MSYQVSLDSFHGPLDLLLYLVKRNEVDILDIPIARLTEQFLEYLDVVRALDVEQAGDFLVMASTLLEIKSRMLLPASPGEIADEEVGDPRRELVRQLLEYRKFKDAAGALEARAEEQAARVPREPPEEQTPAGAPAVRAVELWDLVSSFARLMRETAALQPTPIVNDETPQHLYEQAVRKRLAEEGRVRFRDLFTPPYQRARLLGLFLAVLELIKRQEVWLEQSEPFAEIWLSVPKLADEG
jgi:segregation and condensation protein A